MDARVLPPKAFGLPRGPMTSRGSYARTPAAPAPVAPFYPMHSAATSARPFRQPFARDFRSLPAAAQQQPAHTHLHLQLQQQQHKPGLLGLAAEYPAPHALAAVPAARRRPAVVERKALLVAKQSALRVDAPVFVPGLGLAASPPASQAGSPGSRSPLALCGVEAAPLSPPSSVCSDSEEPSEGAEGDAGGEEVQDGHQLSQHYLYHRYVAVLERALAERARLGPGRSALVRSLYPFWVGRLTHKFNRNMYRTFVRLAVEDWAAGDREGMDALVRFYCASLRALFRDRLFRDFVHFVAAEAADNSSGVENLWLFMKDHPDPQREALVRGYPELSAALDQLEALGRLSLD